MKGKQSISDFINNFDKKDGFYDWDLMLACWFKTALDNGNIEAVDVLLPQIVEFIVFCVL